jgi:hypothetical protein
MLHRYFIAHSLFDNLFASKLVQYHRINKTLLKAIKMHAGLYKINSLLPEYGIVLTTLAGQPSQLNYQFHGKRRRRTTSINVQLIKNYVWLYLDKFIHEFIPHLYEFVTPKFRKKRLTNSYALRIRDKLSINLEYIDLIENIMYDTHKGIYLPLTVHFILANVFSNCNNETYLRMLRVPASLYHRRPRPAFDDRPAF